MDLSALKGSLSPLLPVRDLRYKAAFRKAHPDYFDPCGLMIFCGPQGSGKTLSAVKYCREVLERYPKCKFVSNVKIEGVEYIPYNGLDSLFNVSNGMEGVLFLIDEIHLEFNSLESRNISIEEMIEFSQQRKQRKHIVGTSQVYMRLAKPLREQIKDVVLCKNYGGVLQHNTLIDGENSKEEGGKFHGAVRKNFWWFHSPELYSCYDTYAKMQRYKEEWQGKMRAPSALSPALYERPQLGTFVGAGGRQRGQVR